MSKATTTLTDVFLRKLKPSGERIEISDALTVGLVARVSPKGDVSFVLKARNSASVLKTITLGHFPDMSLKVARDAANAARLALKAGSDVNAEKRALRDAARMPSTAPSLSELVIEYESRFAASKKTWAPRTHSSARSEARQVIERVFAKLLAHDVTKITEEQFAYAMTHYKRAKPDGVKNTANGQVSRGRGYLGPVLDWAAGRKSYTKIGAARLPKLNVVTLANTHDPSIDDPSITGKRTRVLSTEELRSILPLLTYPAPQPLALKVNPADDYRWIAMRFMLLTAARLDEVCPMRWKHIDRANKVWFKPQVKSTKGGPRSQHLPLSDAAFGILESLPGWRNSKPEALVFPNSTGIKPLSNWSRTQAALNKATGTSDWHRHDLRRTAATLMYALKVGPSTIGHILAHKDPFKGENVGGAASTYLHITAKFGNNADPQQEALSILSAALSDIEASAEANR